MPSLHHGAYFAWWFGTVTYLIYTWVRLLMKSSLRPARQSSWYIPTYEHQSAESEFEAFLQLHFPCPVTIGNAATGHTCVWIPHYLRYRWKVWGDRFSSRCAWKVQSQAKVSSHTYVAASGSITTKHGSCEDTCCSRWHPLLSFIPMDKTTLICQPTKTGMERWHRYFLTYREFLFCSLWNPLPCV